MRLDIRDFGVGHEDGGGWPVQPDQLPLVDLQYHLAGRAHPFLGVREEYILLVFCGTTMLYTVLSGLVAVAYSDVGQFVLVMTGRVTLAVLALRIPCRRLFGPELAYGLWAAPPLAVILRELLRLVSDALRDERRAQAAAIPAKSARVPPREVRDEIGPPTPGPVGSRPTGTHATGASTDRPSLRRAADRRLDP